MAVLTHDDYVARWPNVFAWEIIEYGIPTPATINRHARRYNGDQQEMVVLEVFGIQAMPHYIDSRQLHAPSPDDQVRRDRIFASCYFTNLRRTA